VCCLILIKARRAIGGWAKREAHEKARRPMPVHNAEIAAAFDHLADLLEIEGANPFRVRAYRRAARTIEDLPRSAAELIAGGEDLAELPGIGTDLAGKTGEAVEAQHHAALAGAEASVTGGVVELTEVPGSGPKRARA